MEQPIPIASPRPDIARDFIKPMSIAALIDIAVGLPVLLDMLRLRPLGGSGLLLLASAILYLLGASPWTLLFFIPSLFGSLNFWAYGLCFCPFLAGLNWGLIVYNIRNKPRLGKAFLTVHLLSVAAAGILLVMYFLK